MTDEKKEGRPSLYRPEYCEALIRHMEEGNSFESFCGVVEVTRSTIYYWLKIHKEFSDAAHVGWGKCLLFWDQLGVKAAKGLVSGFPQGHYALQMKNRFGWGVDSDYFRVRGELPEPDTPPEEIDVNERDAREDAKRLATALQEVHEAGREPIVIEPATPEPKSKAERGADSVEQAAMAKVNSN